MCIARSLMIVLALVVHGCGDDWATADDDEAARRRCEGDNDWTGSNSCFEGDQRSFGTWRLIRSSDYGINSARHPLLWNDDARISTSREAVARWSFGPARVSGRGTFSVYIPSDMATGKARYSVNCVADTGLGMSFEVEQSRYFDQWVTIAQAVSIARGARCQVTIERADDTSRPIAMDGVLMTIR